MSKKKILTFLLVIIVVLGSAILWRILFPYTNVYPIPKDVIVNNKAYYVEIADTPSEQEKGLSGYKYLRDNQGMLFVFQTPGNYGFWMKDMNFPLDIIWIDQNSKVIHIEKSLSPSTYPQVFYPGGPALYVLEVNAGQADTTQLEIGDTVKIYISGRT